MDNDNSQPLLVVGNIPDGCWSDPNEFVAELAKVLRIPIDTISIIKGAAGTPGKKGDPGDRGVQGVPGPTGPTGLVTFVDEDARDLAVPTFIGQLGVQIDDNTLWIGQSTTAGDWEAPTN